MDMTIISQLFDIIGQNAFPIVVCVYLLYDKRRSDTMHKQEVDTLRETMTTTLNDTRESLTVAINNNTLAMQKILDKIGG